METIMKPLSIASRSARWLMAAGIAVALMPSASAFAEDAAKLAEPELKFDEPAVNPGADAVKIFFEKTGKQVNCDYVEYHLRFGVKGSPGLLADPAFAAELQKVRFDFKDQLPAGLKIETFTATGDGTDALGGPLPAPAVSATANPDDTGTLSDFRLSLTDLDGDGAIDERVIDFTITARIDQAAFPGPTLVDNQGVITASKNDGPGIDLLSQDPAQPDDGDARTGVKTSVLIDVTGCEPPPPPPPGGGEECFEVVDGEVDCVPGGGAFIYHMHVGAEFAGKYVAISATNPGIVIAEGPQLVPAGGGTLDWTIVGAAPGDVVHLIVSGIETYAGPEEGVGLCCSQTVDIIIPPDLDCPDKQPDLKVEKRADVTFCTESGGCDFTITVTNIGGAPYNGPIVLDEVTLPGNASIDSGPNAPWVCAPATSPMTCTHPGPTLNPGASVDLKIGFKPGPGWPARFIRNCAEYDYAASGKEPFGDLTNDRACAEIPLCRQGIDPECTPPKQKKVDLTIRKEALGVACGLDGVCLWRIDVINSGDETINGPLTVVDSYPTGAPTSSDFGPTPPWSCAPDGPGQFRCDHPGIVLVPGASTPIFVRTVVPGDYPGDRITNCAEVQPVPDEADLTNNKACADQRVPQHPRRTDINVEKTGDLECRPGQPCTFEITIRNDGSSAFSGIVHIGDAMEAEGLGRLDGVAIAEITPPFGCASEPTSLPISCDANLSLGAGESHVHQVTVIIPDDGRFDNAAGDVQGRNCVAVLEPGTPVRGAGDLTHRPVGGDDKLGGAFACHDFTIKQEVKKQCSEGFVMNEAGRCVCPEGTTFRNGQCSAPGRKTDEPKPQDEPRQCTLLPGQVRTSDGRCICPDGTPLGANGCYTPPPPSRQCKLLPGMIRTQNGNCICPRGTELKNGACRKVEQPPVRQCKLLPGMIRTESGKCVCPRGTQLSNGQCRKPKLECPRGTHPQKGTCVPDVRKVCPSGTVGKFPDCRVHQRTRPGFLNPGKTLKFRQQNPPAIKQKPPAPKVQSPAPKPRVVKPRVIKPRIQNNANKK
jgi:hypothetical protein